MPRFVAAAAALLTWFACALPAQAICGGQDLRPTLTPQERDALDSALAAHPYPEGNHWRASRGDAVVHLIGTMHLDDPRFDAVAARLAPLVAGADLLLLEMTAQERGQLQSAMNTNADMMLMQDKTLPELLGDADWALLAETLRARGMPPFMAAKFQPWVLAMMLSMPACIDLGTATDAGLDARLEDIADDAAVPTLALEAFDTLFRAFGSVPFDTQLSMIRAGLGAPDSGSDLFTTVVDTYFEEAHAESWLVGQVLTPRLAPLGADEFATVSAEMARALLEDRNRAWIPVIVQAAERAEGAVVAAFGAGHLSGEAGVLALLRAEGFTLERLPF